MFDGVRIKFTSSIEAEQYLDGKKEEFSKVVANAWDAHELLTVGPKDVDRLKNILAEAEALISQKRTYSNEINNRLNKSRRMMSLYEEAQRLISPFDIPEKHRLFNEYRNIKAELQRTEMNVEAERSALEIKEANYHAKYGGASPYQVKDRINLLLEVVAGTRIVAVSDLNCKLSYYKSQLSKIRMQFRSALVGASSSGIMTETTVKSYIYGNGVNFPGFRLDKVAPVDFWDRAFQREAANIMKLPPSEREWRLAELRAFGEQVDAFNRKFLGNMRIKPLPR